jgi:hypothetical protein
MDADLTIPKPKNLSLAEAATIGVGVEVHPFLISETRSLRHVYHHTKGTNYRPLRSEFSRAAPFHSPIPIISQRQRMNGLWFLEVRAPSAASVSSFSSFSAIRLSLHVVQGHLRWVYYTLPYHMPWALMDVCSQLTQT